MKTLVDGTCIGYFSLSRPSPGQPDPAANWQENPGKTAACIPCDACGNQPDGNVCP